MASKVLKADLSGGADAHLNLTVTGYTTPYYITYQVALPSSTGTALAGASLTRTAWWSAFKDSGGLDNDPFFAKDASAGANTWPDVSDNVVTASGFTLDTYHTVEIGWDGTTVTFKFDGTTVDSFAPGHAKDIFWLGGYNAPSYAVSPQVYYFKSCVIGSTPGGSDLFKDGFSGGDFSHWTSTTGSVSLVTDPFFVPTPEGVSIAFTDGPLADPVAWSRIDNIDGIRVTEISIDRGRGDERSKTNPGTVTVKGYDSKGVLDPTNAGSVFSPNIKPVKQASVTIYNPVTADWHYLFRGYVDTYKYTLDPSEKFMEFELTFVDMLDMLNDAEIIPDKAGNTVPSESVGDCYYTGQHCDDRLLAVLSDSSTAFMSSVWPASLLQIASGNVFVQGRVYSRGTSLLQVIDEACDAEYPGSTNRFITKDGAFAFRGRYYRFVPNFYAAANDASRAPGTELVHWHVGDIPAYKLDSTLAVYAGLDFQLGKTNLINTCMVTPVGITDAQLASGTQFASDSTSITSYGPRTSGMSLENLITSTADDGNTDLQETATFADATVHNYKDPVTFVDQLVFKNPPSDGSAQETNTWAILTGLELSDLVTITSTHPGGGGFAAVDHYVESIKYQLEPLQGDISNVTMTVGLSAKAHFSYTPASWHVP